MSDTSPACFCLPNHPPSFATVSPILKPVFFALAGILCLASDATAQISASPAAMDAAVKTLQTYCYDCHTGKEAEGGVRVDFLSKPDSLEDNIEVVEKILRVLAEQQMPPADAEQIAGADRVALSTWIEARLQDFDCGSVSRPGRVTMRRLNRTEYDNTIRDLTGLDLRLANDFPSDDVGNGFDNIGDVLTLPPILMEKYLASAQAVAEAVMANPQASSRVFPFAPGNPDDLSEALDVAQKNVGAFASRAFRRPVAPSELARLTELMRSAWEAGASKAESLQAAVTVILTSPHFIYRVEDDQASESIDGIRELNDYELASRLSYFLWSSMPDERLLQLAGAGELHTSQQLVAEARRMLADPKSQSLIDNFIGQWLQLRDLETLSPDPKQFPEFDQELRVSMRRETELLFRNILDENRSIIDLLNADYSFINQRLADHYGVEGIVGDEFQRVNLKGKRSGVLMHASVLLITSNPTRTSPVKRGKWVLENLLGEPPPPPPPNVPELNATGETLGTLRQQMEQHRADPNCAVCHTKMDALGFGLENFDVVGKWREVDGRDKIDPSGSLPGNRQFGSPVDLVQILAEDKKQEFCRCMTRKMLTYALGRGLGVQDRCTVNAIVSQMSEKNYQAATLVEAIVTSSPFTTQETGR